MLFTAVKGLQAMAVSLLAYEAYVVLIVMLGLLAAEYFFYSIVGRSFFEAKAVVEYAAMERRRLLTGRGKSALRRLEKLRARVHTVAGSVKRYTIVRMVLLLPVYILFSLVFLLRGIPLPVRYCIPLISFSFEGSCVTTSAHLAILTFIAALPIVQEDLIAVLMFKKARR
jgi:hypothetical protein